MATPLPYRSLVRMAVLTAPLLAVGFAGPVVIIADPSPGLLAVALPAFLGICSVAWLLNILALRWRERLGRWRFLQIFIIGGFMIGMSTVGTQLFLEHLPPAAERLAPVRFVNAFAINAIIYVLIDLRLLSDTQARLAQENADLRLSQLQTQYNALKEQLNPHFLFNALGTARSLARRDPALTEAYLIRLSDFMRATLQQPATDLVALDVELKLVRDYVELQQMRFQGALQFSCGPEVTASAATIPYFSLLTLVENAVKHNAMSEEEPLHVRITRAGNRLCVWNNVQPKALTTPSSGLGLANLADRTRILGLGGIEIDRAADHFAVTLNLGKP